MPGDSSLLPLSLNVLVYAHVSVGVFTRTSFFSSCLLPVGFCGWSTCGCLAVDFPGFKVGQNLSPHSYYLTIGRR
jgi:hypothetical protein